MFLILISYDRKLGLFSHCRDEEVKVMMVTRRKEAAKTAKKGEDFTGHQGLGIVQFLRGARKTDGRRVFEEGECIAVTFHLKNRFASALLIYPA